MRVFNGLYHFEVFFILEFRNFWKILKFYENLNFLNFLKILKSYENFEFFGNFLKISEFSLIDDEVQVFRINMKLSSNLVGN
jgi:hypothetical protein